MSNKGLQKPPKFKKKKKKKKIEASLYEPYKWSPRNNNKHRPKSNQKNFREKLWDEWTTEPLYGM